MDDENSEDKFTSMLNTGGLINLRLHDLWILVNKHRISGNYYSWNLTLDSLWSELVGDLEEHDNQEKKYLLYNKLLHKHLPLYSGYQVGFNKIKKEDMEKIKYQYAILLAKEIFLRRLQNTLGKGTAWKDENADYM